jgi:hypothetical protein
MGIKPLNQKVLADPNYWTLARLRTDFADKFEPPVEAFRVTGSRKIIKPYGRDFLRYRPTRFRGYDYDMPSELLLSSKQLKKKISTVSLDTILSQHRGSIGQLFIRAAAGDEEAISRFVERVCDLVRQLENLEKYQPKKIRAVAETRLRWPILLSRACATPGKSPKRMMELEAAKSRLWNLGVGKGAIIHIRQDQRTDWANYWTRLAAWAVEECLETRAIVAILLHHADRYGARSYPVKLKFWEARIEADIYVIEERSFIAELLITEWQRRCLELTIPISKNNLDAWKYVLAEFTREAFFCSRKKLYASALNVIGQKDRTESDRRNMALDRVEQALRSFARTGSRTNPPDVQ